MLHLLHKPKPSFLCWHAFQEQYKTFQMLQYSSCRNICVLQQNTLRYMPQKEGSALVLRLRYLQQKALFIALVCFASSLYTLLALMLVVVSFFFPFNIGMHQSYRGIKESTCKYTNKKIPVKRLLKFTQACSSLLLFQLVSHNQPVPFQFCIAHFFIQRLSHRKLYAVFLLENETPKMYFQPPGSVFPRYFESGTAAKIHIFPEITAHPHTRSRKP